MGAQHNFIKNKEGDLDRVRQYKWTGSGTFPPLPRYKGAGPNCIANMKANANGLLR